MKREEHEAGILDLPAYLDVLDTVLPAAVKQEGDSRFISSDVGRGESARARWVQKLFLNGGGDLSPQAYREAVSSGWLSPGGQQALHDQIDRMQVELATMKRRLRNTEQERDALAGTLLVTGTRLIESTEQVEQLTIRLNEATHVLARSVRADPPCTPSRRYVLTGVAHTATKRG